jgi:hypothetical protein
MQMGSSRSAAPVPPIPSFVTLAADGPSSLNDPLASRERRRRIPTRGTQHSPRVDFQLSEAALKRLSEADGLHKRPLVEELAHVARNRLSVADIILLRDRLTEQLEGQSGMSGTNVTAVRASRSFESSLARGRPLPVREVCLAFPQWPSSVQCHFMKQVLKRGQLPYAWDDEVSLGCPRPTATQDSSEQPQPLPPPPSSSGHQPALQDGVHRDFEGLHGSMLQPLGLALPALRVASPRRVPGSSAGVHRDTGIGITRV